jgi:hypothetical protein
MGELIRFPVERRQQQLFEEKFDALIHRVPAPVVMDDGFFGFRLRPDPHHASVTLDASSCPETGTTTDRHGRNSA